MYPKREKSSNFGERVVQSGIPRQRPSYQSQTVQIPTVYSKNMTSSIQHNIENVKSSYVTTSVGKPKFLNAFPQGERVIHATSPEPQNVFKKQNSSRGILKSSGKYSASPAIFVSRAEKYLQNRKASSSVKKKNCK